MEKTEISKPLLSICIPTYNRTDILRQTLNSIYSQNVNHKLFEVCVSDDSPSVDTEEMINKDFSGYNNLIYKRKVLDNKVSFLNCFEVLKMGNGKYLKLCNDTSYFNPDSVALMIKAVESLLETKPVVFFSMGCLTDVPEKKFTDFNSFIAYISYWSTWAGAFGIWEEDFSRLLETNIINDLMNDVKIDKKFPHTCMLFNMTNKNSFFVDNYKYTQTLPVEKKGGYNLPEVFGFKYIQMVQELYDKQLISIGTLLKIKDAILKFIADFEINVKFEPNRYTFDFSNTEKYLTSSFGKDGYKKYLDLVEYETQKRQNAFLENEKIINEKKQKVENFLHKIITDKNNRPLYVWGIGANAKIVEDVLNSNRIEITGYIDKCGGDGVERKGLPVKKCNEILSENIYVVISMKNVDSAVTDELKRFEYGDSDYCCPLLYSC